MKHFVLFLNKNITFSFNPSIPNIDRRLTTNYMQLNPAISNSQGKREK